MDTTRDATTGIRIGKLEVPGILIELSGELDFKDLEPLRRTFDGTLSSGLPTYVDLSGVTFLDVRCTRELAVQDRLYLIYGGFLAFRDPSWQAEASFKASGFEYLIELAYQDSEQFYVTEAREDAEEEHSETLALGVQVLAMKDFGAAKEITMSSVEAFGWWLADCPRVGDEMPSVETTLWLDRQTNQELLYLSERFDVPRGELLRELLRAAVRDIFKVIPGDPIPLELIPDLHDAGVDPERFRWFDLEGAAVDKGLDNLRAMEFDGRSEGN